jgi:hypothetical protein
MSIAYVALRKFSVGAQHYVPGDPVDTASWPFRRDVLLEGQRFIKRAVPPLRVYTALRDLHIGEHVYVTGDRVDHSGLPSEKLEQLVGLRHIAVDDTSRMADTVSDGKGA